MDILPGFKLCRKGLHQHPITDRRCRECRAIYKRQWAQDNPERRKEASKRWRESNYKKYLEREKKYKRKWYEANLRRARERVKSWKQNNAGMVNASIAKRRAVKKNSFPSWADRSVINKVYADAKGLAELTGIKHNVDHIYPLQSEYMCGLHVETNLQILTQKENISKGNRTWPGQLECQKGSVYARFPKELTDLLND